MNLSPKSYSSNSSHYSFSPVPSLPNYSSTDSDWFLNQETVDIIDDINSETRNNKNKNLKLSLILDRSFEILLQVPHQNSTKEEIST